MRFPGRLEQLANRLRGPQKSLRYRFWQQPLELLRLRLHYATGGSWIDFYSKRLDGFVGQSPEKAPDEAYMSRGTMFLDYLVKHGLKPGHSVLDYGCGVLRAGRYLVPYLRPGQYTGIEISAGRLELGKKALERAGIERTAYKTHIVKDCELTQLGSETFDYVWANSVLTHMPEQDIVTFLGALRRHMGANSQFYFTYSTGGDVAGAMPKQSNVKDFYYPTPYMQHIFEQAGYTFEVMPDGHNQNNDFPTALAKLAS